MPQVGIVRENAILPFTAFVDMTGHEGRPVMITGDKIMLVDDVEGNVPFGVLLKGGEANQPVSVAVAAGGLSGTVRVLLGANVTVGNHLQVDVNDGEELPFYAPVPLVGPSGRWVTAQALESGLAGEKIEAVLFKPEYFGS
jgi:hypothetical protein